jgi:hypothetical protein
MTRTLSLWITAGLALLVAALPAPVPALGDDTPLVGVAAVDIAPQQPVRMYGYASRKTESVGIASRLRAKALTLAETATGFQTVLLTVDCGAVPADVFEQVFARIAERVSIARERFVLCNSHCHSGPDLKGRAALEGVEREHLEQYAQELADKLVAVVLEAVAGQQPARLEWAQGTAPVAANRRVLKDGKWSGFGAILDAPVDHSLPVLRVTDREGHLRAVVINYACHNTTLRGDFAQIHGDWAACAQQAIEQDHPGALALITIGCGADADPHPHGTVQLCEQHGRTIADEVKRVLQGPFLPVRLPLTAQRTEWPFAFRPLPPLQELKSRAANSFPLQHLVTRLETGDVKPKSVSYQVVTWSFGSDLALVFLADEVVVDYALRMKRELDGKRLWITAYANDVSQYIVSDRLIGEGGYEVRNSLSALISSGEPETVQPSVETAIVERVRDLLPAAYRQTP